MKSPSSSQGSGKNQEGNSARPDLSRTKPVRPKSARRKPARAEALPPASALAKPASARPAHVKPAPVKSVGSGEAVHAKGKCIPNRVSKSGLSKDAAKRLSETSGMLKEPYPKDLHRISYQRTNDQEVLQLIDVLRGGIPFTEFDKIAQILPFTMEEWATFLHVSLRTLQRGRKEETAFQSLQAERILEILLLYKHGMEVFANQDKLNKWLTTPTAAMGGKAPQDLLDTKLGVDWVNDELGRIEHGVLA